MTKIRVKNIVLTAVLLMGITLMAVGILEGDMTAIMRKAAMVCLECIGIG